jgi:hypothetical protein
MRILLLTLAIALTLVGCGGSPSSPSGSTGTGVISLNGSLDFGSVIGGATKELTFSISNSGSEAITVSGITLPAGFTASWSNGAVAPGQVQNVAVRFRPTLDQNYSGTLTVSSNAGGSNTLNISARGIRTGRVIDPIGDIQSDPRVPVSPDLTDADVRASGGVLSITLTFAPGTVSPPSDIFSFVVLDTDENPATGFAGVDALGIAGGRDNGVIGVDYMIWFVNPRGSTVAEVFRTGPTGVLERVGTTGVSVQSMNQFVVGVPLSLLGGDDGHLGFKVNAGKWASGSQERIRGFDFLPDIGLPTALTP